jgi:hypothetical protein
MVNGLETKYAAGSFQKGTAGLPAYQGLRFRSFAGVVMSSLKSPFISTAGPGSPGDHFFCVPATYSIPFNRPSMMSRLVT